MILYKILMKKIFNLNKLNNSNFQKSKFKMISKKNYREKEKILPIKV